MFFKQFYLGCLAHASYLIGDEESGAAVVVDPQRDIDQYLEEAGRHGLTIRHVVLTHFHADFVAGHLELRDRTGATIHLGRRARAEYGFDPVKDGDTIDLGKVRLGFLETPGHTTEGISILVYDLAKDAKNPHAVLTGDTLFVGAVGRPDLMASVGITAEELAGMLYDSLREKLMKLPDATLVYPAHGAGSLCGKNMCSDTFSTIGDQKKFNYALQPMSREEFIELMVAELPEAPPYFAYDAELNKKERPLLENELSRGLAPLPLDKTLALAARGAQILDVREADHFAAGHLRDSLNIPLSGKYATWSGFLLDRTRPIVIVAERGKEREAALRLGRIGFDHVEGYLEHGFDALERRPDLVTRTQRMSPSELARNMSSLVVIDVRNPGEWEAGHIASSLNVPLPNLRERIGDVPRDVPVALHCQTGYRSSIAASLLEIEGYTNIVDVVGGFAAWKAAELATV